MDQVSVPCLPLRMRIFFQKTQTHTLYGEYHTFLCDNGSGYTVTKAGLKLPEIPLPQLPKCWEFR